ncbi:MAG: sugar transferase [Fimbriimonadaceae bacterium]|nr:sugar transferase [Chitinophagales bacterium]
MLDITISLLGVIIFSPFIIITTAILLVINKGKPFFTQIRPGKNAHIFSIIKFKTMNDAKDADGELLPDAHRLTAAGKLIRRSSLDEVLQLINVIKGDMSLVGPRPLLIEYLPIYSIEQNRRHLLKPGITGWAQINGRNAISWKEKFLLDVWYVENYNFILDIKIIFITFKKIFSGEGVSSSENITMPPFNGYN